MMRAVSWLGLMVLLGCEPSEGGAITHDSATARQVSTLLATVVVEVDGAPLNAAHIAEVHLEVDGEPWGVFSFDTDPSEDWSYDEDGELVLRAQLHRSETLKVPRTAGEWRGALGQTLKPGDHVARISTLMLRNGAGDEISLSSSERVVFEVDAGDASAWIGDIRLTMEALP